MSTAPEFIDINDDHVVYAFQLLWLRFYPHAKPPKPAFEDAQARSPEGYTVYVLWSKPRGRFTPYMWGPIAETLGTRETECRHFSFATAKGLAEAIRLAVACTQTPCCYDEFLPMNWRDLREKLSCTVGLLHNVQPVAKFGDWVQGVHGIQMTLPYSRNGAAANSTFQVVYPKEVCETLHGSNTELLKYLMAVSGYDSSTGNSLHALGGSVSRFETRMTTMSFEEFSSRACVYEIED
jgi:hypothetical protein